jgi:hypothetical protein
VTNGALAAPNQAMNVTLYRIASVERHNH